MEQVNNNSTEGKRTSLVVNISIIVLLKYRALMRTSLSSQTTNMNKAHHPTKVMNIDDGIDCSQHRQQHRRKKYCAKIFITGKVFQLCGMFGFLVECGRDIFIVLRVYCIKLCARLVN